MISGVVIDPAGPDCKRLEHPRTVLSDAILKLPGSEDKGAYLPADRECAPQALSQTATIGGRFCERPPCAG